LLASDPDTANTASLWRDVRMVAPQRRREF
jgi:hypothetical protein